MKINGTIFSKPQQDQLKRGIGAELDKVVAKVEDVDARMLNYMGDWASGNEYHENDVVTWGTDGHLYEIIKAHTSSSTIDPSNTEYYKAMTATKYVKHSFTPPYDYSFYNLLSKAKNGKRIVLYRSNRYYSIQKITNDYIYAISPDFMYDSSQSFKGLEIWCIKIERTGNAVQYSCDIQASGVTIHNNYGTLQSADVYEEV